MSITDTSTDVGASAPDTGTQEVSPQTTEPVDSAVLDQPAVEPLPYEQFENHTVPVKVGDQESPVSLKELRDGYLRQSDYTKKTQEVAEARKRLSQVEALAVALEKDPHGTLKALNAAYQYDGGAVSGEEPDWDSLDPQERRLMQVEAELEAQRSQTTRQQIEAEFRDLESQFGEVDRDSLISFALKNNVDVTSAYKLQSYDRLLDEQKRLKEEQDRTSAKRQAQVVSGGGSSAKGAVTSTEGKRAETVRDAYVAALRQVRGN